MVEATAATEDNWSEFCSAWEALLSLRTQMEVQKGQQVLECLSMDDKVLIGLGVAFALRNFHGTEPPDGLLKLVKDGPIAHIKKHSYLYFTRIQDELSRIERIKAFQSRWMAAIGALFLAIQIAFADILANYIFNQATAPEAPAVDATL